MSNNSTGGDPDVEFYGPVSLPTHFIVFMAVGAIGILDNGFVLLVLLAKRRDRSGLTNLFIVNQSLIDFVTSIFLLVNFPTMLYHPPLSGLVYELFCRFWLTMFFLWSLFLASTYNLLAITMERYMEIVHPITHKKHFTRKRALGTMVAVWVFGLLYNTVVVLPTTAVRGGHCQLGTLWPNEFSKKLSGIVTFLIQFIIPIIIMIYCYTKMARSLKVRVGPPASPGTQLQDMAPSAARRRQEKMGKVRHNILKTLIMVCTCFALCWSWNQIYFVLFNLGVPLNLQSTINYVGITVAFINSIINPIIYTAQYRQFQVMVKSLFCRRDENGLTSGSSIISTSVTNAGAEP